MPSLATAVCVRGFLHPARCAVDTRGRCQPIDHLFGGRVLVANVEWRVPVMGLRSRQIRYNAVPMDAFAFADGGITWSDSDRIGKEAVDSVTLVFSTGRSPLIGSVGAGLRINLLSFPVEMTVTRAFGLLARPWSFGFGVRTGFQREAPARMDPENPHAKEMADESMVRTLAAQADAIWPQERPLFDRYRVPRDGRILDAGCGTGEISIRLAQLMPGCAVLGVDVLDVHLDRARARCEALGLQAAFEHRSIFDLALPDKSFDLVVCRHVLQAVPRADRAIEELARVTRSGGWLHLLVEDYLMIAFEPRQLDPDDFWGMGPRRFGDATGTDLRIGRKTYGILRRLGLEDIRVDYVVVDPIRVPRATFAAIWRAWRDGYAEAVAAHTSLSREEMLAHFDDMIATVEDPEGYGVWQVPIVAARVP